MRNSSEKAKKQLSKQAKQRRIGVRPSPAAKLNAILSLTLNGQINQNQLSTEYYNGDKQLEMLGMPDESWDRELRDVVADIISSRFPGDKIPLSVLDKLTDHVRETMDEILGRISDIQRGIKIDRKNKVPAANAAARDVALPFALVKDILPDDVVAASLFRVTELLKTSLVRVPEEALLATQPRRFNRLLHFLLMRKRKR